MSNGMMRAEPLLQEANARIMPLLIVNPTYLSAISVFTGIKSLSDLEVRWSGQGQSEARPKALWNDTLTG
jgi:hypothetical protein